MSPEQRFKHSVQSGNWRKKNRPKVNASMRIFSAERGKFIDTLKARPCMDCGGSFPPECMDFDHRVEEVKNYSISRMRTSSEKSILEEMTKCDLVCANCHRIRTKKRQWGKK